VLRVDIKLTSSSPGTSTLSIEGLEYSSAIVLAVRKCYGLYTNLLREGNVIGDYGARIIPASIAQQTDTAGTFEHGSSATRESYTPSPVSIPHPSLSKRSAHLTWGADTGPGPLLLNSYRVQYPGSSIGAL
jgi:hypothetical protein